MDARTENAWCVMVWLTFFVVSLDLILSSLGDHIALVFCVIKEKKEPSVQLIIKINFHVCKYVKTQRHPVFLTSVHHGCLIMEHQIKNELWTAVTELLRSDHCIHYFATHFPRGRWNHAMLHYIKLTLNFQGIYNFLLSKVLWNSMTWRCSLAS